tara:strand:- start:103 stop:942 length:840 start_codon:yes stop_codon:yes gene_type:complete
MRIVLVARDQALRIASAVVRARDFADRVAVINLDGGDETTRLAEESGADVIQYSGDTDAPSIAKVLVESTLDMERTVIIALDQDWKLSDMARTVGLSRQGHDVFIAFKHRTKNRKSSDDGQGLPIDTDTYNYSEADIQFSFCSKKGLLAVAEQQQDDAPVDLSEDIELRVVELDLPPGPPPRESLASASRFAQFFYWMLESKHPLILFGVPGAVFFWVGFEMANELISFQGPHNGVSLGVALAAFTATLVGVFSLTTSLILYVLGKQVNRVPNRIAVKE